jgi:uncharacterized protein YjgD (DUF1641 family)
MPYIKEELRKKLDYNIDTLIESIKLCKKENRAGVLNYCVSRLLSKLYNLRYSEINEAVGALECIKQEYYRRIASSYEDEKIIENGDVY